MIRWTSTNTAAVWVNEATGRVEARGVGSASIYATAQDGTGVKGSCAVQVHDLLVFFIFSLNPDTSCQGLVLNCVLEGSEN